MTPEERAEEIITWPMPDTYHKRLVEKIARHIREAIEEEREACAALVDKAADALAQGCYYANTEGLRHLAFRLRQRREQP